MVISAILKGKKKELLPPPPPFPKFGADDLDEHLGSDDSYMAKSRPVPAESEIPPLEELGTIMESRNGKADKPKEILDSEEEIRRAIESISGNGKEGIFSRLFGRKKVQEEIMPAPMPRAFEKANSIEDVHDCIKKARAALMDFNLGGAKRNYIEAMRVYNNLSEKDKKRIYHDLADLYEERKNAESLNSR